MTQEELKNLEKVIIEIKKIQKGLEDIFRQDNNDDNAHDKMELMFKLEHLKRDLEASMREGELKTRYL